MNCYLCANTEHLDVKGQVRDNPDIKIKKCSSCGLVFLEDTVHIEAEFYENNGMSKTCPSGCNFSATDAKDTQKRFSIYHNELKDKNILDFGCGSGSFLTKLKKENTSPYLYALEPNKKYHEYLSSNFNLYNSINEITDESLDYITMFHVMEHLKDPLEILNSLYKKLNKNGRLIIEVPSCDDALLSLYDSDAFSEFTYWSCHLYLFNNETLRKLLEKTAYKVDYIKQYQRYPISNHLYWLANKKAGGHEQWDFLDDADLNAAYEKKLASLGKCDTIIAMICK